MKQYKTTEQVNKLYNKMMQMNYGDIITHKEIEQILDVSKELSVYNILIKKAKDMLVEKSKIFKSIPGIGLQLLKPEQVSGYTYRKYINRTLNLYNYSSFILDNLDTYGFNDFRLDEFNDVVELNNKLKDITSKTIRESHYINRRAFYDSLED